jgi:hypothetical protein
MIVAVNESDWRHARYFAPGRRSSCARLLR